MQIAPIAHLARKIRSLAFKTNYRFAAAQLHILDDNGCPNPGLAYRIAEHGEMPGTSVIERLIRDGALPQPEPRPLNLTPQMRRAILLALRKKKPLPPPDARTVREFNRYLACKPVRRRRRVMT